MNSILLLAVLFAILGCSHSQTPVTSLGFGAHFVLYSVYTSKYVTVDPTSLELDAAGTDTLADAALFSIGFVGGDSFAIIYNTNGLYLSNEGGGTDPVTASRGSVGSWENYFPVSQGSGEWVFQATINGNYLTVQTDDTIIPTTSSVNSQTTFYAYLPATQTSTAKSSVASGDQIILFSNSSQSYVTVDPLASRTLEHTTTDSTRAAIFYVGTSGSFLSLLFKAPLGYVSAESAGTAALVANRGAASTWEQFSFTAITGLPTGWFTIKAQINGNYVKDQGGSPGSFKANSATIDSTTSFYVTTPSITFG